MDSEAFNLLVQAAIFIMAGVGFFAVALDNLLPFFGVPRVPFKNMAIVITSLASLFWSTWLFPMGILLLVLQRPLIIVFMLTLLFVVFNLTTLATTYLLSKLRTHNLHE